MTPLSFTFVFLLVLVAASLTRLWLSSRQMRHVALHRSRVPAKFADQVDLPAHQKAADYTVARNRLALPDMLIGAVTVLGFTLFGGLQWLHEQLLASLPNAPLTRQLLLIVLVSTISGAIDLPLSWYRQFRLEERFGFNRMTLPLWLGDMAKGALLGAVVGLPLVALILWLMQVSGSLWWLWAWAAWTAFSLVMMVLAPTIIAPLFNKFSPLPEGELKDRLNALLQRCGFRAQGLYVMDGGRRSAHANAYFTGIGKSKRIVLYDTLIEQLSINELEAVLAHEIGHYKRKHINKRLISGIFISFVTFAALGWLFQQPWFYQGLGVTPGLEPRAALALLLFFFVLPSFSFFLSPLVSRLSRSHEFEADAFAAEQTGSQPMIDALLKLYRDNASTLTPDPVHSAFYDSHPNAVERIGRLATR
jgi:STE24 endopeptidase